MATKIIPKRCSKCKRIKAISAFYKNKSMKDGYHCWCKSCDKIWQKQEGINFRSRYQHTDKFKACQKQYRQSDKGKLVYSLATQRFNRKHPERRPAINAVNNAIRSGKLPRPDTLQCHYGDHPAEQYHHWHGYEKEHWLDVVPTCRKCHKKIHSI